MDELEYLLSKKDNIDSIPSKDKEIINFDSKPTAQKSNSSASLFDFIKMVDKLVTLTMPNVKFLPDEGKLNEFKDTMKEFQNPIISYKVISRKPKDELKPRVRETIVEKLTIKDKEEERLGQVYGMKFKCIVQFNVIASVYKEAEEVMEKFEELIMTYTGFFKKNGVAEIIFNEHSTDESYNKLRETFSVRNLKYYVEIEKTTVIFKEKIKEIEILAQNENDEEEI